MRTADFKLSPEALQVIGAIKAIGARPYLVGGCVRDTMLGLVSKDFDIEVHGLTSVEPLIKAMRKIGRIDEVGKAFGCMKMFDLDIDITLPRRDSKVGSGHRGFDVEVDLGMTTTEAASRRDFTINSMMFDPITETLLDPFHGQIDLRTRIIRHTSEAFAEDPLRVLRGVRFATRFGFALAGSTAELCLSLRDSFSELATERVWGEWEGILLKGRDFITGMQALRETGWDEHFPELSAVLGDETSQAAARMVGFKSPERKLMVVMASLVLESGQSKIKSIGAPRWLVGASAELAREVSLFDHMYLLTDLNKMARRLSPLSIQIATEVRPDVQIEMMARLTGVFEEPLPRLVDGHELIAVGYEAGPLFKDIFDGLKALQDDGVIRTKEEAWAWIEKEFPLEAL